MTLSFFIYTDLIIPLSSSSVKDSNLFSLASCGFGVDGPTKDRRAFDLS